MDCYFEMMIKDKHVTCVAELLGVRSGNVRDVPKGRLVIWNTTVALRRKENHCEEEITKNIRTVTCAHLCQCDVLSPAPPPHRALPAGPELSWCSTGRSSAEPEPPASVGPEPRRCFHTTEGAPNTGCPPAGPPPGLYCVTESESY